jgi:hypothetical protein
MLAMQRFAFTITAVLLGTPLMAQQFPNPQPNEHHKVLAAEAGTWDSVVKMYLSGPDGPATEYQGVEHVQMVAGGLFSRSTFTGDFGDRKFEGHGLFGWDPNEEQYTGLWVDNFNGAPTLMTGTYDADTKTLTFHSTIVDGAGNPLKQKQVTTFVDERIRRFESYLIVEQGGRPLEVKLMEITSTKRE